MDHDKAARRALLIAKALKHHASVIHNPASIMGNPPPPVARYGMVSPHLTQIAPVARADGGEVSDTVPIFPKPQRMFPEENRPAGGQYLNAITKEDMTGHKAAHGSIGVLPGGRPYFNASKEAVEQTGTPGRGSAMAKTNLFKQKAGWKWVHAPEGHEDTNTIVSVEHRGAHHYALNAHFPKGVDLARYPDEESEPRLRPTTYGNITKGDHVGTISVRGKGHPVYDHVIVKSGGGFIDPAFTDADETAQMKYIQDPNIAMPANQVDQEIYGGGYADGGSADPEQAELQRRMQQILRPDSDDPEMVQKFLKAQASYEQPTHERGAYSNRVLPMPAHDVQTTIGPLGNAVPEEAAPLTWNAFHKIGKGGTIFTLGGDRSNLGRLTHINGKPLSWPVDLHAGTKYMAEPNPGAVWANALGAASALRKNIREAAKKGPVYGAFAPMGPRAVDSSNNMFDALMAQVPTSDISPDDAVKFDKSLQAGEHIKGNEEKRAAAQEVMKSWPGIQNAEKARDFASKLSGAHRSAIVKHMEAAPWQKAGFPSVGMTRAAITDPDLLGVAGNLMGHHVVELDPESYDRKNLAFDHSTYGFPTGGKLVGRLPLIERQVAMPDYTDQQVMDKSTLKSGEPTIIHPYSPNAQGRSAYRGNTEMRQAIQPINERMLESIQQTHGTGFADGGEVHETDRALHLTFKFGNSLPSAVNQAKAATRRRP